MKAHGFTLASEHAINHECVDMHIQIKRAAETLNDRHRSTVSVLHTVPTRATAKEAEQRAHVDGHDGTTQIVVPRQDVPQSIRQTQDPLPDRYI